LPRSACSPSRRRTGRAGFRTDRSPGGTAARHDDLFAVGDARSEVQELELGLAGGTAGARDGVGDPSAVRNPVEARPPHGTDDVDVELRGRCGAARSRHADWRRHDRRLRPEQKAAAQREDEDEHDRCDEHTTPIQSDLGHVANGDNNIVTRL
jgi:hypothetical protein